MDISEFIISISVYSENECLVNQLYQEVLGRQADPEGLNLYSKLLDENALSPVQLKQILLDSEEYKNKRS